MFIKVNKDRLHTVSFGKGPRTFLTHGGWVGNWEVWQQLFELMSESWRCVGYDHRGAGESPVPPETITPETVVDDLFAVMDTLEIKRCVLGESQQVVSLLSWALCANPIDLKVLSSSALRQP
jgi:3-oxoadipate enol-lactonase